MTLRIEGRARWPALILLCLGELMIVLDTTIVNVALPSIKADGATMRYRDVITVVSANERTLTSFGQQPDGSWKQFMQAKYTRTS